MTVFFGPWQYETLQVNGQRRIGPPLNIPEPPYDFELFVKNLPRNVLERELVPLFSTAGFVYQIRLLMCFSGLNRGIAFVRYTNELDFCRAVMMFHDLPIRGDCRLYACRSMNLRKLVILDIEPHHSDYTIRGSLEAVCGGRCVYIGLRSCEPGRKYAILAFRCHYETALARRKLMPIVGLFGDDCYLKWYRGQQ